MHKQPLVSIIIPTYNRAHLIGETLDSVMAQTYIHWECLVVDDGSTDETEKVIKTYIAKDARFQFYRRPEERLAGGNAARNYGLERSKGSIIQWFDSDDIMFPDYLLERLKLMLEAPKANVVFCAYTYFNENGIQQKISNQVFNQDIIELLIHKKISFSPLSYLIRKEIINEVRYDESLKRAQDLDFFFRLFTTNKFLNIKHCPKILFKVRKHSNTISGNNDKSGAKLNARFIVNKRLLNYFYALKNEKAILIYKQQCLLDLKRLLENKNYMLVIKNILHFKYFSITKKIKLLIIVFSKLIIGRGTYQFQ